MDYPLHHLWACATEFRRWLLIDHFGWFRMQPHPLNTGRIIGGVLLVGGISLIANV